MKDLINFLKALSENNNREWFDKNREEYLRMKLEFENFVTGLITELSVIDPSIGTPVAKDCIFRIFRDVRFSHDKLPYKTNFGAFIANGGRKSPRAGYYIHIEPGKSMIAGGIYMPPPDLLKKLRQEIYFNAGEFRSILDNDDFVATFSELSLFDKLRRPPKDFPADFPDIEYLKYKSYSVGHSLSDETVLSDDLKTNVLDACKTMLEFNRFLNRAVEN